MQKFKHNNTNIWIWKICLLKIYLTESWWLRATGWFTAEGGRTQTEKRKLQEKIFWTLKILHSLNFFCSFSALEALLPTLLTKKVEALFIGEDSDLKFYWICNLEKVWNPSRVETVGYWSLQRENLFSLSKTCYFPILHVGCKVVESRQILLFMTFDVTFDAQSMQVCRCIFLSNIRRFILKSLK